MKKCEINLLYAGASSGIGAAIALEFAKNGCGVAITGRNKERLEKTAKQCQEAGLKPEQVGQTHKNDIMLCFTDVYQ